MRRTQLSVSPNPFKGDSLLEKAYQLAKYHHHGQKRKGGLPYITHPVSVAKSILSAGYGRRLAAAGLLHDVLEDTGCEYEEVLRTAGPTVTRWVVQVTDRDKCAPWRARKRNYLRALSKADKSALVVACADKNDNLRGLLSGLKKEGGVFEGYFSTQMAVKIRNYENIYRIITKKHASCRLLAEYKNLLGQLKLLIQSKKSREL